MTKCLIVFLAGSAFSFAQQYSITNVVGARIYGGDVSTGLDEQAEQLGPERLSSTYFIAYQNEGETGGILPVRQQAHAPCESGSNVNFLYFHA